MVADKYFIDDIKEKCTIYLIEYCISPVICMDIISRADLQSPPEFLIQVYTQAGTVFGQLQSEVYYFNVHVQIHAVAAGK